MELVLLFLRTCSCLMLHYIKITNLVLYDLDWLFELKTHWVAEESERLICEIYTKKKFHKIYVVQWLLTNILSKTKKSYCCLEIFSFLAMVNWIQCCSNFSLLNLMLHFVLPSSFSLFSIFQLSSTVFAFSGLNTVGSSLTFLVLFFLLCYFNIIFFIHGTVPIHCKQCIWC